MEESFSLGLHYDIGKSLGVEKQEVDTAFGCLLEFVALSIEVERLDREVRRQADVGGFANLGEETPASCFEQFVDLYPRGHFVHGDLLSLLTSCGEIDASSNALSQMNKALSFNPP